MFQRALSWLGADDADHVDAEHAVLSQFGMISAPRVAEPPQSLSLAIIDSFEGVPERETAARLHLDDAENARTLGDDVDLALRTSPVTCKDLISTLSQMLRGTVFPRTSEIIFRCHEDSLHVA